MFRSEYRVLMHRVIITAICLTYFAGVLAGAPMTGPDNSWLFLASWSAAFVWCYLSFARGGPVAAVAIVVVVTIVCPIVALIAVLWPIYRSWPTLVATLWPALKDRGPLGALEFVAPLFVVLICVPLVRRLRVRIAHDASH